MPHLLLSIPAFCPLVSQALAWLKAVQADMLAKIGSDTVDSLEFTQKTAMVEL